MPLELSWKWSGNWKVHVQTSPDILYISLKCFCLPSILYFLWDKIVYPFISQIISLCTGELRISDKFRQPSKHFLMFPFIFPACILLVIINHWLNHGFFSEETSAHNKLHKLSFFLFSEANCELLENLFHSLDISHESIKLTAKITAVCIIFSVTGSAVTTCL